MTAAPSHRAAGPSGRVRLVAPARVAGVSSATSGSRSGQAAASPASPDVLDSPHFRPVRHRRHLPPVARGLVVFLGFCAVLGVLSGLLWHAVVHLPTYTVQQSGAASTTERGLTEFFGTDAWFSLIGAVCGALIGLLGWWLFRWLGWFVTLVVVVGSNIAALIAWHLGEAHGPGDFAARISAASAGQSLPIDFRLRSHSSVLVWLLFAVLPVLLFSALGRDDEDPGVPRQWVAVRRRVLRRTPSPWIDAGHPAEPSPEPPVLPDDATR